MANFVRSIPIERLIGDGSTRVVGAILDEKQGTSTKPINGVYSTPSAYLRRYAYYETHSDVILRESNGKLSYPAPRDPDIHKACQSTYGTDLFGLAGRLLDQARLSCSNNYYDSALSLGTDLAEMGSTLGMLSSTINRISAAYKAIRKRKVKEAVHDILGYPRNKLTPLNSHKIPHSLRGVRSDRHTTSIGRRMRKGSLTAANAWLEVTYGWTPLVGMLYDWAGVAQNGLSSPKSVGRVRSKKEQSFPVYAYERTYLNSYWHTEHRGVVDAKAGITLTYSIINPAVVKLDHLGLADPTSVAWELVPYSFVVDWFMPVGDTLRALSAYKGLAINGTGFVKVEYSLSTRNWYDSFRDGRSLIQQSEGEASGQWFRRHLNERGRPSMSWSSFAPKLGATRLTSAISLLIQSFSRGK